MSDVLFSKHSNGAAEMTLNRPQTINSLTYDMLLPIKRKLLQWERDPEVKMIVLKGSGVKGFCAGGDMKALYDAAKQDDATDQGRAFFELEYEVDQLIDDFAKPIIALMDGIVMGGGVGLSAGASHRIVTDKTKWAMPEMNIGFFPDVGAAYHLNKAPGYIGRYLALTATVIKASDVMYIGAGDYFVKQEELDGLINDIKQVDWFQADVMEEIQACIDQYVSEPAASGTLATLQDMADTHFRFDTMEDIIASLENSSSSDAADTLETLKSKSPISLKVTLKQLADATDKSYAQCLETDFILACNFMNNPDFLEGVRSVLIDKDHKPNYQYQTLVDVSDELVTSYFE